MKKKAIPQQNRLKAEVQKQNSKIQQEPMLAPTSKFTQALAREIVKNLTNIGQFTTRSFRRMPKNEKKQSVPKGEHPVLVDTSVLIDARIVPIVNSGFFVGTIIIPQFILREVQHVADSADALRRAKGRRGLDVVSRLKSQKANPFVKINVVSEELPEIPLVDQKLISLAKRWNVRLLTVDFNLASVARLSDVKVLSVNDLAQALKIALMPGEECVIKITHEGKERQQGVGYLSDGTMVVVEDTKNRVGQDVGVVVTKVHQTPAGQLFFAKLK